MAEPVAKPLSDIRSLSEAKLRIALVDVGRQVQDRRFELGLKRLPAAKLAGVSTKHLADLEDGSANVSLKIILRVLTAFGIPELRLGPEIRIVLGEPGEEIPAAK